MEHSASLCVTCAWRQSCNKKFLVDGTTTTRCPEYTRDVTLKEPVSKQAEDAEKEDSER